MLIKVLTPHVIAQQSSYHTVTGTVSLRIGFLSQYTNVVNSNYPVTININDLSPTPSTANITMLDISDVSDTLVTGGVRNLNVIANSFSTELEVGNLENEKVYELTIAPTDPTNMQVSSVIISTMTTDIQVVGRTHVFTNPDIRGNTVLPLDDNTVDFVKGVDLLTRAIDPDNRGTLPNPVVSNAVIVDNGQYYAYCPTYLITTRADYPDTLYFKPLAGMTTRSITVHKIPRIIKRSNILYSIVPPTRIRIVNGTTVDVTTGIVSLIDLSVYGITSHLTQMKPVFNM